MSYISVNSVDHYYEWITARNGMRDPNKPVMVFLHGWGGSARYWEKVACQLSGQFDCLLYDLRGFGRSSLPSVLQAETQARGNDSTVLSLDFNLEGYAEDLLGLLQAFEIDRVYLNSHSTGASIAIFFLNRYPERVVRAILTCNGLLEYDERAFAAFHRFSRYVVQFRPRWLLHVPELDRLFIARFLSRPISKADRRAFLEDFIMADYAAALGTALSAVSQYSADVMPQQYAQISMPTLLISGEFDQIISAEMGKQAAALNKNVEYKMVKQTGHFPMLEDAETYMQYVNEFLCNA